MKKKIYGFFFETLFVSNMWLRWSLINFGKLAHYKLLMI